MSLYRCSNCNHETASWLLQCPECGSVNHCVAIESTLPVTDRVSVAAPEIATLDTFEDDADDERIATPFVALDSVTGEGFVPGSVTLLAGAPGAGKSTLSLQVAAFVSQDESQSAIYICGEEPLARLNKRARRLSLDCSRLLAVPYTETRALFSMMRRQRPTFCVVDSLHVVYSDRIRSRPGSPSQVVKAAQDFVAIAQKLDCAVLLVGHVTKNNMLSGPRSAEHAVDVVITFQPKGDRRVIEATKNRFGPALEKHYLKMTARGLVDA